MLTTLLCSFTGAQSGRPTGAHGCSWYPRPSITAAWIGAAILHLAISAGASFQAAAWAGDSTGGTNVSAATLSISKEELHDAVFYLADDAREGREAGTPGGQEAAEYLRDQLQALGLQAAGTDGYFQPFGKGYRNILAEWPSAADADSEIIVLGAHYDHVGYGSKRNVRDKPGIIHNGADDNASGTAAVLEIAEAFTLLAKPPRRRILFALWDAEEKGLLGSKHWVENPTRPLDKVRFLVNMDMIGRLRDARVEVYGIHTSYGLRELLSELNHETGLRLVYSWWNRGDTDHAPFFRKDVPYLLFHTGMHEDYHAATDDAEKINVAGMEAISRLIFELTYALADQESPLVFRAETKSEPAKAWEAALSEKQPWRDRAGISTEDAPAPELGGTQVRITEVRPNSPAARAGLEPGWNVVAVNDQEISSAESLAAYVLLARSPAVRLTVSKPDGSRATLELPLEGEPLQLGIQWRPDDAEPRGILVTHVLPGSSAEQAGICPGDYIFAVDGEGLSEPQRFDEIICQKTGPFTLLVDHEGQGKTVTIRPVNPLPNPLPPKP